MIEDEPETQRLVAWILSLEGMRVDVASNGQEALIQLEGKGTHPLPDLILLDLLMPVLNGVEFLEWKKNAPEDIRKIPVLITSGAAEIEQFIPVRVAGILKKPIAADLLIRTIQQNLPS